MTVKRTIAVGVWALVAAMIYVGGGAAAKSLCEMQHPFHPPRAEFSGRCPNCGMMRAMWARTWHTYTDSQGLQQVCSLHCLADRSAKSGEQPQDVQVALYLAPGTMVSAVGAYYVVGSNAPGTMSPNSKLAFADEQSAQRFAADCGGRVMGFADALSVAAAALPAENRMIAEKRLKAGKIVLPTDNQDRCRVCEMFPARYPRHRCQLRLGSTPPLHFCSTQCLFSYLSRMPAADRGAAMVWVTDTPTGDWISALTAFYVVDSGKLGPMGFEAFAFAEKTVAEAFVEKAGKGRVLGFEAVTPEMITGAQ